MPKMKTHKATRKVLNIRQSGSITKQNAGNLHNTGKKSSSQKKKSISMNGLTSADYSRIKNVI